MAEASESSDGKTAAAAAAAAAKTDETTKKSQDSSPSNADKLSSKFSSIFFAPLIIAAVVVGAAVGAHFAVNIIESEYQIIVAKLQSDHQAAILHTQSDYMTCQSHLSNEKLSNEEGMAKLKIYADRNERAFQQKVELYLNETTKAYKMANGGLIKASARLRTEIKNHETTQLELAKTNERLKTEFDGHETARRELSHVNTKLQAHRNSLTESMQALLASDNGREEAEKQLKELQDELGESKGVHEDSEIKLKHVQRELDAAEEELDKRDLERAECDDFHRNMMQCRESLQEALVDLANAGATCKSSSEGGDGKTAAQLVELTREKQELNQQVQILTDRAIQRDERLAMAESKSKEKEYWEKLALSMKEKIAFRSRKEVLEQFGDGPYHVKLTLGFESSPENESILLELAPLDSMPHTIHMFLQMVEKKFYLDGTFILSREHILVGGPVDAHNRQKNEKLEHRMVYEGFFPNGLLMFMEHSPEWPHLPFTLGFNHVGGPIFYINLQDNKSLHGPNNKNGGDPCFARIIEGVDVIQRIANMPTRDDDSLVPVVHIADSQVVNMTM